MKFQMSARAEKNETTTEEPKSQQAVRLDKLDGVGKEDRLLISMPVHIALDLEEHDGLIWKELLVTGEFPGNASVPPLTITLEMLEQIKRAFDEGAVATVEVPLGHTMDASRNTGFVRDMEIRSGEVPDEWSLWIGIEFTEFEFEMMVRNGTITNVSAFLVPNYTNPVTGREYPLVLFHAALTNKPVLQQLEPFLTASLEGLSFSVYKREEVQGMDPQEAQVQDDPQGDGDSPEPKPRNDGDKGKAAKLQTGAVVQLSQDDLKRLLAEARRDGISEGKNQTARELEEIRSRAVQAESLALAHQTRLHINNVRMIMMALQGKGEHDRVKMPAGYAFAPTVVAHVRPFLEADETGEGVIALSVEGKDEKENRSVSDLVLDLLNVITECKGAALVSLASHGMQSHTTPDDPDAVVSNEEKEKQVTEYLESRGLMPVGSESAPNR